MRYLPAYVAITLVVLCGVVHGFWTNRWQTSRASAEAAARLERLPFTVGDWQAEPLAADSRTTEPISSSVYRRYLNRSTGAVVTIALVCGLPGPVSIHTPDVCYRAGGFKVESPGKYRLPAGASIPAAAFLTSDLHKTRSTEQIHQRIFWSWNARGTWRVPDNPRWVYAAEPVLYKLYLIRQMNAASEPMEDDPCIDLLRQLLPQLQKYLVIEPGGK